MMSLLPNKSSVPVMILLNRKNYEKKVERALRKTQAFLSLIKYKVWALGSGKL